MTIGTNGFIGWLVGICLIEHFHGCAMEVGHVCIKNVGGYADPRCLIGVTLCA
jgi:hypothetical protein